jgi:hypothetical protein
LLLDAGDVPVPLHVVAPSAAGQRRLPVGDGPPAPQGKAWIWRPGEALLMPALPRPSQEVGRATASWARAAST